MTGGKGGRGAKGKIAHPYVFSYLQPATLRLPLPLATALAPLTGAPAALTHDGDRHVAIIVLGGALLLFVAAVAAGAALSRWEAGAAKYDGR